jgi:hypothetical protein
MWRLRGQVKIAVLGTLVLSLPASPQTGRSQAPAKQHFESSAVSFDYSYPMVLCQAGASACPGCESPSTVIACVTYNKKIFSHYNVSDGPRLSIAVLDNVRDQAKCLALPEDEMTSKLPDQQFNGVTFKSVLQTEGAMSHSYRTYFYRTFHNGRCYDLELFLATVNAGVFDAAERPKEFTDADERKVVNNFKRMLDTLRLPGT